ncbi:MAG TPA: CRTAC1 family protein [Ilumatobacteraceae bacterium]
MVVWFNPTMPDPRRPPDAGEARRRTARRARWWIAGIVLLAITATGVILFTRRSEDETSGGRPPRYVEEAAAAGIDHVYAGDFEFFVGGGVAAFDCNDDGRNELFFAGGTAPAALYRNESDIGGPLRFAQQTSSVTDLTAVTGAYPLDVDGDGHVDLAVLRRGGNELLRGLGDCAFESANDRFGLQGGDAWTAAFSAMWEGSNTLPTLAFGNYLVPGTDDCAPSDLVRPASSGDRYASPVQLAPGYCTLSVLFSDWSRSGRRDLRVTNDRHYYVDGEDQLWRVAQGEPPRQYTATDGWKALHIWGMGIASQDLTGDGVPEVFITSQGDNKLQTLAGTDEQPTYQDIALKRGVTAQRPFAGGDVLPSTAWHPEFEDVNNDGLVDLFVSKGNVEAQPDYASRDPSNLLIGQTDGTFAEGAEAAGIVDFERARGASLVDLNLDGMLDLVVVNRQANIKLWRNVGSGDAEQPAPMGHWVAVRLLEAAPNVDAVGAWVELRSGDRTITREVTVGGGHAGGKIGWIHFGLGQSAAAEVRVQWPDGETGPWTAVTADQFVTIERGVAGVVAWQPGA